MRAAVLLLVASLALPAFSQEATLPCGPADRTCAFEAAKRHVSKKAEFWKAKMALPLEQRIGAAPPELIELLALDSIAHGYPNKPRAPKLTPGFLSDVRRAFDGIPAAVKQRLRDKLVGIYFVDDIGSTGFMDQVEEASGEPKLAFIVLDPSVLMQHTANSWASWREGTPFKAAAGWKLDARIADGRDDTRANAIQYILLHEMGHALSVGAGIHPTWTLSPKEATAGGREFPYYQQSWRVEGEKYATVFDAEFPQRKDVVYYFGPRLDADAMPATYAALERTSFATLYAATHPGDDFAEAFANYVHVVLMRKPFEIRLENEGRVMKRYGPCWDEPRCRGKREFLERFLAG